jgi:putative DNA primase/helicase
MPGPRCRDGKIEMYSKERFFVVTGHRLASVSHKVEERQDQLDRLYHRLFGPAAPTGHEALERKEPVAPVAMPSPEVTPIPAADDTTIIDRARSSKNGEKFSRLWSGDRTGYSSGSEADLGLCSILAYHTGGDAAAIDRLFRQSKLYRDKWDRDDYRQRTIAKAIDGLRTWDTAYQGSNGVFEAAHDPHRIARIILKENYTHREGRTLVRWAGCWWAYDGIAYREIPTDEMRALVNGKMKEELDRCYLRMNDKSEPVRQVTKTGVENVLAAMESKTIIKAQRIPPTWMNGREFPPPNEVLPCNNGLLHVPSGNLSPHTPTFFGVNALDYAYDPDAKEPIQWLSFLRELWGDDQQSIDTLQEVFGYTLLTDTSQQKIFLLVGPRRSGKGTIARVLTGVLGPHNVAGPTLSSLSTNFGLSGLVGKSVALVSDARISPKSDTAVIAERLLSISGEDFLTVDRKYHALVTMKLTSRFVILTNELPKFGDSSNALVGRMIILRMTQSFYGKEDPKLTDRLLEERPGILLWAIEGWKRLQARGYFIQPASGQVMLRELEELASPISHFVEERCGLEAGVETPVVKLFSSWQSWCSETGRHPGDVQTFGRNLRAAFPQLETSQPWQNGRRVRVYRGIALAEAPETPALLPLHAGDVARMERESSNCISRAS